MSFFQRYCRLSYSRLLRRITVRTTTVLASAAIYTTYHKYKGSTVLASSPQIDKYKQHRTGFAFNRRSKSNQTSKLKIYGVPISQPARAILFLCALKGIDYELIEVVPIKPKSERQDYINNINPIGAIPAIENPETGFIVYESPAIMTYLAMINGWNDLYPSPNTMKDIERRALIDQYLNWHHENIRKITKGYFDPVFKPFISDKYLKNKNADLSGLIKDRQIAVNSLSIIENVWLSKHEYIVDNELSLADILCYEELVQVKQWPYLFKDIDLKRDYPNVCKWMDSMEKLEKHDEIHGVLDKSNNYIMERVKKCKPFLDQL